LCSTIKQLTTTTDLESKLVEIFFKVDNFCKELSTARVQNKAMQRSKKHRNRKGKLTLSFRTDTIYLQDRKNIRLIFFSVKHTRASRGIKPLMQG